MGRPGMAGPAHDRIVVAAPHVVDARFQLHEIVAMPAPFGRPVHLADYPAERKSTLDAATRQPLEHRHHPLRSATVLLQGERGRPTPDLPRMLDPHNTHGAMPTRCPSYFGVGLRRASAPAGARRATTPPSIPPGSSGLLPPTDAKVWPIPSSNRFALHGFVA